MTGTPEQRAAFCLVCGHGLELREAFGRDRKVCTACGYIVFENTATAGGAIVVRGREVLLIRRGIEPAKGRWCFPAGFQNYGEAPRDTAIREVQEETGLQIRIVQLHDILLTRENPRKLVNLVVYLAVAVAGELAASDDALEARFFDLDALPDDLAFANNREILAQLRARYPTGDIL